VRDQDFRMFLDIIG